LVSSTVNSACPTTKNFTAEVGNWMGFFFYFDGLKLTFFEKATSMLLLFTLLKVFVWANVFFAVKS
jgi:hypothetical protein